MARSVLQSCVVHVPGPVSKQAAAGTAVHIYIYTYVHIRIYVCTYIYVYMCMYIYRTEVEGGRYQALAGSFEAGSRA